MLVYVEDEAAHVLLLFEVHSSHRLVEKKEIGLHRQRPPEFDAFLQAVGQLADRRPPDVLDLEKIDDVLDDPPMLGFLPHCRAVAQHLPEEALMHFQASAGHDVVERRHALE